MVSKSLIVLPLACLALLSACAENSNSSAVPVANTAEAPKPEETSASMLALVATPTEECPELTGTYLCPGPPENPEKLSESQLVLSKRGGGYHFRPIDDAKNSKPDFIKYMFSKYLLDDGGLIVDGTVIDKTAKARGAITAMMNVLSSPILRRGLDSVGIDFNREVETIDLPTMRVAYTASCQGGKLRGHYVFDKVAGKATLQSLPNGDLSIVMFGMDHNGVVKKDSGTCRFVSKSVATEARFYGAKNNRALPTLKDLRGAKQIAFELVNKEEWTLGEPISLLFQPPDLLTRVFSSVRFGDKNIYVLTKAYFGETDDFWYDDIDMEASFRQMTVNLETLKVTARNKATPDIEETIGEIFELDGKFYIDFKISFTFQNSATDPKLVF